MERNFLAGLVAISRVGPVVDLTFPDVGLSCHVSSYIAAHTADLGLDDDAYAFMQRFRSCGGRVPIVNLGNPKGSLDLQRLQGAIHPEAVLYAGVPPRTLDAAGSLLEWAKTGRVVVMGDLSFLVRCQPILRTPALGILTVQVVRGAGLATMHYLMPPVILDRTADLVIGAMQQSLTMTDDTRYCDRFRGVEDVIRVVQFTDDRVYSQEASPAEWTMRWTANSLIHDGRLKSESNSEYSWLWIDADGQLRVLLGMLPQKQITASVSFTRVAADAHASGAQLIYNGRPIPTEAERWSDQSGRLIARFFPEPGDLNVLGIAMPESARIDTEGPFLAGCIDSLELR